MKRILLSDAHLIGLDDPNLFILSDFLNQLEADEVYFLGDMFHFFWGFEGYRDPNFEPLWDALEGLKTRNCRLHWVRGNHDFHLGGFVEKSLGVAVQDSFSLDFGGHSVLLVHGDEADDSRGYRLLRRLVRGGAFARVMNGLGPRGSRWVGLQLAGRFHHDEAPNTPLLRAQAQWAEERFREGLHLVVLGHSHAPGVHRLNGGTLVNLGDFSVAHTYLELNETLKLSSWKSGQCHTIQEQRVL